MAADCEKKRKLIHIKVLDKKGKQFVKKTYGEEIRVRLGCEKNKKHLRWEMKFKLIDKKYIFSFGGVGGSGM